MSASPAARGTRAVMVLAAAAAVLALPLGRAEAKKVLKMVTKTVCSDLSLAIPDGPQAGDFVGAALSTGRGCPKKLICGYGGLPLGAKVRDVDAKLRLTHPSVGDLTVLLVSPTGGLTTLAAQDGGSGDDFGTGSTGCAASFTTFDDSAATPIEGASAAQAPFAGSFRPQVPLAQHVDSFGGGDWRFYFDDVVAGNQGTAEAVELRLRYRYIVRRRK